MLLAVVFGWVFTFERMTAETACFDAHPGERSCETGCKWSYLQNTDSAGAALSENFKSVNQHGYQTAEEIHACRMSLSDGLCEI